MRRGFTLIEIMIVIAVIAILIGISLPHFKGMQDEGRTAEAAGELRTLATAIESYYIHNSKAYPNQGATVDTEWQTGTLTTAKPTIVTTALMDPFKPAQQYGYATSAASGSQYYVAFSVGPDGTAGITGISTAGAIVGTVGDDIYMSNGTSGTGGF
jgi:type II secretion system protein G